MSKYRVNFRKIAEEHLPFALRTESVTAFVTVLLSGLRNVRQAFDLHSQDLNRRLSYNSQIANLQRLLNDTFDTSRQIEVLDAPYYEVTGVYDNRENKPLTLGMVEIPSDRQWGFRGFLVRLPATVHISDTESILSSTKEAEIRALINRYRFAGTTFTIIYKP